MLKNAAVPAPELQQAVQRRSLVRETGQGKSQSQEGDRNGIFTYLAIAGEPSSFNAWGKYRGILKTFRSWPGVRLFFMAIIIYLGVQQPDPAFNSVHQIV